MPLGIWVALFACMTIILCLNIDITGWLEMRDKAAYTVIGGWSLKPDQLQIGFTRLLYPFFMGLLLSRVGWMLRLRGGFWWCSLMIIVLLAMPWMGYEEIRWTNGLYEALCILVAFPLIVAIGAGSSVTGRVRLPSTISWGISLIHYTLPTSHSSIYRWHG